MNSLIRRHRSGFTLMEIMVVIIVIAVLASVAGPMIGSITDQGKTAATKANMNNIKTALANFNNDLGKFPFTGSNSKDQSKYNEADSVAINNSESTNVLVSHNVGGTYQNLGIAGSTYAKRWKGPYMDTAPHLFIMDSWAAKIRYFYHDKQIFLQSPGADGNFDKPYNPAGTLNAAANDYEGDDILVSVSRVKF